MAARRKFGILASTAAMVALGAFIATLMIGTASAHHRSEALARRSAALQAERAEEKALVAKITHLSQVIATLEEKLANLKHQTEAKASFLRSRLEDARANVKTNVVYVQAAATKPDFADPDTDKRHCHHHWDDADFDGWDHDWHH